MNESIRESCYFHGAPLKTSYAFEMTLGITLALECIPTILLNGLFIIIMWKYKRYQYNSDVLYIFLAVSDLSAAVLVMPMYSSSFFLLSRDAMNCSLLEYIFTTGHAIAAMSISTIMLITCDVYLSIQYPFFYEREITTRRILQVNIAMWTMCILLPILFVTIFRQQWFGFQNASGCFGLFTIVILSVMQLQIFLKIRGMKLKVAHSSSQTSLTKKNKKQLMVALSILVTFSICFIPMSGCCIYLMTYGDTVNTATYILPITHLLVQSNALFDPFIYYYRLNRVKDHLKNLVSKEETHTSSVIHSNTATSNAKGNQSTRSKSNFQDQEKRV